MQFYIKSLFSSYDPVGSRSCGNGFMVFFVSSYFFIVSFNNNQQVLGATATNFDSVSVKYFVEFVWFREVYI